MNHRCAVAPLPPQPPSPVGFVAVFVAPSPDSHGMTERHQLQLFWTDPRRERARQMPRAGAALSKIKAALGVESTYLVQPWVNDIPPPRRACAHARRTTCEQRLASCGVRGGPTPR